MDTAPASPVARRLRMAVFIAGLALLVAVQLAQTVVPAALRAAPVGSVDAWSYIGKAEQLIACPLQDCPALIDLRRQLAEAPSGDPAVALEAARQEHRVFYQYHPLHSVLLAGLRLAGLPWGLAHDLLAALGALLIAAGTGWLLYRLWGPGAAGLALLLLAFVSHPGFHGTHWIVPGNMAWGLGVVLWAAILQWRDRAGPLLVAGVLMAVWMHPVGRIHAVLAILLFAAVADLRAGPARGWLLAATAALAASVLLPFVIDRPSLTYVDFPPPAGWTLADGLRGNLAAAGAALAAWLGQPLRTAALLLLAAAGLALVPPGRRRAVLALGLLVCAAAAASLLHVLPGYPGEAFQRVSIPLVVFLAGAAGHAAWSGAGWLAGWRRSASAATAARVLPGGLLAVTLFAWIAVAGIQDGAARTLSRTVHMTLWGEAGLDPAQPARVLAAAGADAGPVLYLDEWSLYFWLSHGGLARHAFYYPLAGACGEAADGWRCGPSPGVVAWTDPVLMGRVRLRTGVPVAVGAAVEVDWSRAVIRLENGPGEAGIEIRAGDDVAVLTVAPGESLWVATGLASGARATTLEIVARRTGGLLRMTGLRPSGDGPRNWPWDAGYTLSWEEPEVAGAPGLPAAPGGRRQVALDSSALLPAACRSLGVIDDAGAIFSARVSCPPPAGDLAAVTGRR